MEKFRKSTQNDSDYRVTGFSFATGSRLQTFSTLIVIPASSVTGFLKNMRGFLDGFQSNTGYTKRKSYKKNCARRFRNVTYRTIATHNILPTFSETLLGPASAIWRSWGTLYGYKVI